MVPTHITMANGENGRLSKGEEQPLPRRKVRELRQGLDETGAPREAPSAV
jgi:hypothetical protein